MPASKKRAKPRAAKPTEPRMSYWIARTLREERQRKGVSVAAMATLTSTSVSTVNRWEDDYSYGRKLELDRAVAGYAYALGFADGRQLWEKALAQWVADGTPAGFTPQDTPAGAFADSIRQQSLRHQSNERDEGETR